MNRHIVLVFNYTVQASSIQASSIHSISATIVSEYSHINLIIYVVFFDAWCFAV